MALAAVNSSTPPPMAPSLPSVKVDPAANPTPRLSVLPDATVTLGAVPEIVRVGLPDDAEMVWPTSEIIPLRVIVPVPDSDETP